VDDFRFSKGTFTQSEAFLQIIEALSENVFSLVCNLCIYSMKFIAK